jgi:hypothetical protein
MSTHDQTRAAHHRREGRHHDDGCGPQCGVMAHERNRYYTGRYLTARDFRDEQAYFLSRHRLHNRLLHGWGVVCGLQVERHRSECPGHVIVNPGIAIDCCGRELVLRERTAVAIWLPPEQPAGGEGKAAANPPDTLQYLLYLHYAEQAVECVPAIYAEDCSPGRLEANRLREQPCLAALPWDERARKDHAGCWQGSEESLRPCAKGCGAEEERALGCVEPDCPCDLGVPLALITLAREGDGYRVVEDGIEQGGIKRLPPPKEYLTSIVSINWPHGGSVSLAKLRTEMGGQLKVSFDRKLAVLVSKGGAAQPKAGAPMPRDDVQGDEAFGINRCTFVVQYGGRQKDIEFLDARRPGPHLAEDCVAVFPLDESFLDPDDRNGNIAGNTIYITLKCDFIPDCNGNPVDGNFLGGRFPTGDGVAGGAFESWFRVTYD